MLNAKARWGFNRIVVDDCPYCHRTHYHSAPVGEGARMADCFKGEYLLDFESAEQSMNTDVMPCGHSLAEAYQGEDGGTYCRICESA